MTDVEKYGLFAVVLVGGLLAVIAVQGGFSGGDGTAAADDALPVVMEAPVPLQAGGAGVGAGNRVVRVKSILPDKPFRWDESPAPYPGERSSKLPATVTPLGVTASPPAGGSLAASGTHVVAANETLSDIAEKYLGSKTRWEELRQLNPGLDPKKLQIGQVLRVSGGPPAPAPPAAATAPKPVETKGAVKVAPAGKGRTHTVAAGDTLGGIAKKYLGSSGRADDLFAANRDVLKSPDELKLGQVLKIP